MIKTKIGNKSLSLLLTLCMVVSLFAGLTVTASATGTVNYEKITISEDSLNGNAIWGLTEDWSDSITLEGSTALYAQDPERNGGEGGLPVNGILDMASGVPYQLASQTEATAYYGNDCIWLHDAKTSQTMVLETVGAYEKIYVLATAGGPGKGNYANFSVELNYTDGTKSEVTYKLYDWFDKTEEEGIERYDDIMRKQKPSAGDGYEQTADGPVLHSATIEAENNKLLSSIAFTLNGLNETGAIPDNLFCGIFAVTGATPEGVLGAPVATAATDIEETSFTANWDVVEGATSYALDVATTSNFTEGIVSLYNNKIVDTNSCSVTGLTDGTTYYYRVRAVDALGQSLSSNVITVETDSSYVEPAPSTHSRPSRPATQDNNIENGMSDILANTESNPDSTVVVVDGDKLEDKINESNDSTDVVVNVPKGGDAAVVELPLKNLDTMKEKDMTLVVTTDVVRYELPAKALDTDALKEALGASDGDDVSLDVTISKPDQAMLEAIKDEIDAVGGEITVDPIVFTVTATLGDKTVEADRFVGYVPRVFELTAEQAAKITTAVVYEEDGTLRHIPTFVYKQDGKYYAKINAMTNSVYTLIFNEQNFIDTQGKWFEDTVKEMTSRKIINGRDDGIFDGDANITRAEFAALLVRALGLPENGDASTFNDLTQSSWCFGAIGTAHEYGIVDGRTANTFDPDANITRQEAMAMVHRAATLIDFSGTSGTLDAFSDADSISDWAINDAQWNVGSGLIQGNRGKINGQNHVTRGETATIVLRLLQKSQLVDVRTEA